MTDTTAEGATPPSTERRNPFVGPRSFHAGEALYGRSQEIGDLRDLLIAERIVLLYSPSGAGKTSLLEAGLRPELARRDFRVLPTVRVSHEGGRAVGANRYLQSTLVCLEEGRPASERLSDEELAAAHLPTYLDRWADDGLDPCLFFDQFEELFTLDPTDVEAKAAFLTELGVALRDRGRWALFAMREDFIAQLDPYLGTIPKRLASRYRLDLLGVDSATAAARLPAAEVGVDFTADAARRLVDDLRTVRVQRGTTVSEEPGPYVEPVQLQVVCRRLWTSLGDGASVIEPSAVEALGSVDDALADFYVDQVQSAARSTGVSEREIRAWVDEGLITEQGFRTQLSEGPGHDGAAVLSALEDGHLIRAERRRGTQWYELAHDRLVPPIRASNAAWREANLSTLQREAQAWDERSRPAGLLMTGEVLASASGWADEHPDELLPVDRDYLAACQAEERRAERERTAARRNKRLAVLASAVGVVAVLGLVGALLAYRSASESEREAKAAAARERVALAESEAATSRQLAQAGSGQWFSVSEDNEVAKLYAYEAHAAASSEPAPDQVLRALATTRHHLLHDPIATSAAAAVTRDGQTLVRGTADGRVELVDVTSLLRTPLADLTGAVTEIGASPTDDRVAVQTVDTSGTPTLSVWDVATRSEVLDLDTAGIGPAGSLTIAGSPGVVATIAQDANQSDVDRLVVWDAQTGARLPLPEGDGRGLDQLAVSPDGNRIAATDAVDPGAPITIHVWERDGDGWRDITPPGLDDAGFQAGLAFDEKADLLAFGTDDGRARVTTLATGGTEALETPEEQQTSDVAFLPDGRVRTLTLDGIVTTFDRTPAGTWAAEDDIAGVVRRFDGVLAAAGSRVLSLSPSTSLSDAATGEELVGTDVALAGATSAQRDVAVRGSLYAGPAYEQAAAAPGWKAVPDLGAVVAVAASTDGSTVAALGPEAAVLVEDRAGVVTEVEVPCPQLTEGIALVPGNVPVAEIATANDATHLGLLRDDGLCLWSPAAGAPRYVPAAPGELLQAVAIDGPGTMAVLGSNVNEQGIVSLFGLEADQLLTASALPGSLTAVAAGLPGYTDEPFVYAGGDDRGNVVFVNAVEIADAAGALSYSAVTTPVVLPVDAPVVALDMVFTDTGTLLAVATPAAVFVYAFEGESMTLVGGYDLLRGEGKVLDLGFRDGDPKRLAVLHTDQSVYEFDPRAEPGAVAADVRASASERGLLLTDERCQELVGQPCPKGAG